MNLDIVAKSNQTKYLQVVNGIKELIRDKVFVVGSSLPSIREVCQDNHLSQETVIKAYNELKKQGIIESKPRMGYFVANDQVNYTKNVLLLFDELSEYKKILYNTLRVGLEGSTTKVDVYFHHCNIEMFETLIRNKKDSYNVFIIMSFNEKRVKPIMKELIGKHVLLLDRKEHVDENQFSYIVQNFDSALYNTLNDAYQFITKYKKFTLVFPETDAVTSNAAKAPKEIKAGFTRFCKTHDIPFEIVSAIAEINKGEAFFVIDDLDMVNVITLSKEKKYTLGKEVGLISYNDSPIKNVIGEGVTVVSTDFEAMGKRVTEYILEDAPKMNETIETKLIIRKSL